MTAQSNTASISGSVIDGKTQKPIPSAVVVAIRSGVPNFTRNTRSGGDGAFLISGLAAGNYTLCVQTPGAAYLPLPMEWRTRNGDGGFRAGGQRIDTAAHCRIHTKLEGDAASYVPGAKAVYSLRMGAAPSFRWEYGAPKGCIIRRGLPARLQRSRTGLRAPPAIRTKLPCRTTLPLSFPLPAAI